MSLDRYATSSGLSVALGLVNELVVTGTPDRPGDVAAQLLAFDPTSVADRPAEHGAAFLGLARSLHAVVVALDGGHVDAAADLLNELLAAAPAVTHLAKEEDGRWSLHHHREGADVVEAWTAICAEAFAQLFAAGHEDRVHLCAAANCGRAFVDTTKNATRRYCSERCQNRAKATALRRRRSASAQPDGRSVRRS